MTKGSHTLISTLATLSDLEPAGRRVLVRADLNVPLSEGAVGDDSRIRATVPVLEEALTQKAAVLLVSHLGRPQAGRFDPAFSLAPVAERLSELLGREVPLVRDWLGGVPVEPGALAMCENVRFVEGETANDDSLAQRMAGLCEIFVNDAFAVAHRKHASTCGIPKYAPASCAGPLMLKELRSLSRVMEDPERPLVAIVGGAKIRTKLPLLRRLIARVDWLIPGGGIANALLAASGRDIGASALDLGDLDEASALLHAAAPDRILLPEDLVCAKQCRPDAEPQVRAPDEVAPDEYVLDLGPRTRERIRACIAEARTAVWSGPMGTFEFKPFSAGTRTVAEALAGARDLYSLAGGGETLAAISRFDAAAGISYLSSGGGAFLRFLERGSLPAVDVLAEARRAWLAMERARDD